jgi:uncharacterized membrane protein
MALDFSKLTATVKSVADLAASHADLSALAKDAKAVEDKAQVELDSIVAALEAALGSVKPFTTAEAVGVTAVATALSDALVSPIPPAAPAPVEIVPVSPVAVGLTPAPQTVEEYNALRAAGLI